MSHFDELNPQWGEPEASKKPTTQEEPVNNTKENPTEFADLSNEESPVSEGEKSASEQETPEPAAVQAPESAPEQPQYQQTPPQQPQYQQTPPQYSPYPPQGWGYAAPNLMQEEAKRREKLSLKRLIKSDANKAIGLVLIFVVGMQFLASVAVVLYEAIAGLTGYGFSAPVYDFFFSYFPVIVCETLALIIGLFWFKTDVKQLFRKPTLQKGERHKAVLYTGFSLGLIQIGSLLFMAIYYLLLQLDFEIYIPEITADTSNVVVNVLSFAYIVVFGPLLEEIFFRGILFQKLRKYGDVPTILITAMLFALFHGNFVQLLGPFLFGIAIGIVASKTNSLWLCWIIHALNNLISTVYDYLPESVMKVYDFAVPYALMAIAVLCFVFLKKDLADIFKNRRGNCTVLSAKAKFGCMVNNACFYIFVAVWLALSLLVQITGSLG